MKLGAVHEAEARIRGAWESGDHSRAATLLVRRYGPEIMGFLGARVGLAADANDVFGVFCEDLWSGLPRFEWRCSARTWAYTLARHAALRYQRTQVRQSRVAPSPELQQAVAHVRTTTENYRKTSVKNRMRELRERLPDEDQTILILRVDKEMSWQDVALVLSGPDARMSAEGLSREASRLRKRFQLAKRRLRRMAESEGLLRSSSSNDANRR